jgi:hypothetical protein
MAHLVTLISPVILKIPAYHIAIALVLSYKAQSTVPSSAEALFRQKSIEQNV